MPEEDRKLAWESNAFAIPVSTGLGLLLTVVAGKIHNLCWLLWAACLCFTFTLIYACRGSRGRWWLTIIGTLLLAGATYCLSLHFCPRTTVIPVSTQPDNKSNPGIRPPISTPQSATELKPAPLDRKSTLAKDVQTLARDILGDEIAVVRLSRDWDRDRQTYPQKFVESDTQFDAEFAQPLSEIFSRLATQGVDISKARDQFKDHEVLDLGFELERISQRLEGHHRTLTPEDRAFLIDRFGLNAKGWHSSEMGLNYDSTLLVYAQPGCEECKVLAEQLRQCAKQAKWKVNDAVEPTPVTLTSAPGIVTQGSMDGLGGEPPFWLSRMGFETTFDDQIFNRSNPYEVKVFVGRP